MADKPIPVRQIAGSVTVVDDSGKETHRPMAYGVLPPAEDACQICAGRHPPETPHNAQSIYYQTIFNAQLGRAATWADAMAHCSEPVRAAWEKELRKKAVWTEPPNGEKPVKHHGIEDGTVSGPVEDDFRQAINDD